MSWSVVLAENTHNFVRAESLRPLSLEFVALLIGLWLAWRHRAQGLAVAYAFALPFNDVVYRLGPMTLADVVGIAIIVTRRPRVDEFVTPLIPWLVWGTAITLWIGAPFFSVAYTARFVILLVVASTVPSRRSEGVDCVRALAKVTVLAAAVALGQVVLWRLGFPIDGVFASQGFIRPKVLSHEPSTASMWFALAIPLLTVDRSVLGGRLRNATIVAILVGTALTLSLSGLAAGSLIVAILVLTRIRQFADRRQLFAATVAVVLMSAIVVGVAFRSQATLMYDKVAVYVAEFTEGPRPVNIGDVSGREGDLLLVDHVPPGWLTGSGLFMSPELAAGFEAETGTYAPASNILLTTALETGVLGLALFVIGMFVVSIRTFGRHRGERRAFSVGFLAFEISLLGQRFLAFPQPWFMLAIARSLAADAQGVAEGSEHAAILSDGRQHTMEEHR